MAVCPCVWRVHPDQSWLINCPLSCWFLAEMDELCSLVVDPADVQCAGLQCASEPINLLIPELHSKDFLAE